MAVKEIFQIPGYVQVKLSRKHLGHNVNYQNKINMNKTVYINIYKCGTYHWSESVLLLLAKTIICNENKAEIK